MNWLNFLKSGGENFTQNDLLWMGNGLKSALGNALSIRGVTSYVVSGARPSLISRSTYGNTSGIVVLNGEVCVMDADTIGIDTIALPHIYIETVDTFDISGLKTFAIGGPYNMYKITKCKLKGYASIQSGKVSWTDFPYIEDIISSIAFSPGAPQAISGGILALPAFDNVFELNIGIADTLSTIIKAGNATPVIWLKVVGANPSDTLTISPSSALNTPGGLAHVFQSGDWIMITDRGSIYDLVTKGIFAAVTVSGGMLSSWAVGSIPFTYRKNAQGMVTLDGLIGGNTPGTSSVQVYQLPVGYRPSAQTWRTIYVQPVTGPLFMATVVIDTAGYINVSTPLAESVPLYLNGISFYIL